MGIIVQLFELGLFLLFSQCCLVSTSGLSLESFPLRYNKNIRTRRRRRQRRRHEHDVVVDHFSKSLPLHTSLCILLLWILAWGTVPLELVQPSLCGTSNLQLGQGTRHALSSFLFLMDRPGLFVRRDTMSVSFSSIPLLVVVYWIVISSFFFSYRSCTISFTRHWVLYNGPSWKWPISIATRRVD